MVLKELSQEEVEGFLQADRIIRLGMDADGERYLVPLGYAWVGGSIYCVTIRGRKTEMARRNPEVSFQVDNSAVTGPFGWTSVIGEGRVEFVTDPAEIGEVSPILFGKFGDMPEWAAKEYEERGRSGALVWLRIVPVRMTGRESGPPQH